MAGVVRREVSSEEGKDDGSVQECSEPAQVIDDLLVSGRDHSPQHRVVEEDDLGCREVVMQLAQVAIHFLRLLMG